jgi:hypothetical protein
MSDRDNDQNNQAIDPPENTAPEEMSMDAPQESPEAIDPPENTKTKQPLE